MAMSTTARLPWTYRPLGVRVMLTFLVAVLLGMVAFLWFALPGSVRDDFTPFQVATLLLLLAVALTGVYGLMRCRVRATDDGVEIVNVFRRRQLEWAQILQVSQRRGDPWAVLDVDDGTAVAVMAIQGSDGARARAAVLLLRGLVEAHTRTSRDD
ncbi:MAG: PH domain-containing protein, partial [Propionibacteriales bacterium]|nr:PH domain-containing protein [Propionibacteriales bacterium]